MIIGSTLFYWPILLCDWFNVEIITMIFKAGLVDPTQNQFEIRRCQQLWKNEEIYKLSPSRYINPLNLMTLLLRTPFHNRVLGLINETNVNDSLPTTN